MRKVIYKEWVPGVETAVWKEYINAKMIERANPGDPIEQFINKPTQFIEGTNCNIEKEGLFHGFFPTAFENNNGSFGNFSEALIEAEDGSIIAVNPTQIRFVDSPEDEQRAEFAKAAMQGMLSNSAFSNLRSKPKDISAMSIAMAKDTISELKKQKP